MHSPSLTICLWLPLVPLVIATACNSRPSARGVSLIVSGDTAGWIAPCACSARQSGGLARRATLVDSFRQSADVVPLDVGGAPSGTSPYDVAKFTALLKGEKALGTAAHNLGGAEIALGAETLRDLAADTGIAWVSANARDPSGKLLAPPARLIEAGGGRLAIIGVVSPKFATAEVRVDDPAAAVLDALGVVDGQYDAAIVLAYLPTDELEALAKSLPEIDIVVGGPTLQTLAPRQVGPTLLAAVTSKGKYMAHFRGPAGMRPGGWTCDIVELDDHLADDAWQLANLDRFHALLVERDFAADETSFAPRLPDNPPEDYRLAGTATCQACHQDDCTVWQNSKHATAWATLKERASHGDPFCQQCHTTGYGMPGGFASLARGADRVDVGCESCHGPSSAHAAHSATATTFVARDQCLRCHDHENSPEFAFAGFWEQIRHGQDSGRTSAERSPEETVR